MQRHDTFCDPIAFDEMIVNVEESSFNGVIISVGRLVRVK